MKPAVVPPVHRAPGRGIVLPCEPEEGVLERLEQRLRKTIEECRAALDPGATVVQVGSGDRAADGSRGPDIPAVFTVARVTGSHGLEIVGRIVAIEPDAPLITGLSAAVSTPISRRPTEVAEALDYLAELAPTLARLEAERLTVATGLVQPKLRAAVVARARETWPWTPVVNLTEEPAMGFVILAHVRRMALAAARGGVPLEEPERGRVVRELYAATDPMPADVAPIDALRWVRDALNALAKGDGDLYEANAREVADFIGTPPGPVGLDLRGDDDRSDMYLSGRQLAWAYSALASVQRDRERPAFKAPANRHAHAVVAMLVRPPSDADGATDVWTRRAVKDSDLVLTWDGKAQPYQLKLLGDEDADLGLEIAQGLIRELGPDALRDWMALLRIASRQGATGDFRWTWEEHRDGTYYADLVKNGRATDAELAHAVRRRIWRMKRAELWAMHKAPDGKVARLRIGPFGLVDVDAELMAQDGAPIAVNGKFNPHLYAPRGPRAEKAGFTLLPDTALTLPDKPFRIYSAAVYQMRRTGGVARLRARTLWEYAGIAESQRHDRKRWPQCRKTLERALADLSAREGVRWTGGGDGPEAVYELTAPAWWTDRLVHHVGPALPAPASAGVPRTGPELEAMRRARGLSQRAVADVVGANQSTVARTEKSHRALPPDWLPKLAAAKLTMPG